MLSSCPLFVTSTPLTSTPFYRRQILSRLTPRRPNLVRCSQQTPERPFNDRDDDSSDPNDNNPPETDPNWREFRAALVAGSISRHQDSKRNAYRTGHWAHPLSLPETGCYLASHPAYYRRRAPYLTQAVVLITHYDRETGATGLVLNRPLAGTAEEIEATGIFGRSLNVTSTPFAEQPVYIGGPNLLQKGILSVLHSEKRIAGQQQPMDGVFVCDLAYFLSSARKTDFANARLFSGCIRWPPGALENEVDEGSWYCVAASELFAVKHCIQLPKPLWVELMQSQGGVFERIANRVLERSQTDDDQPQHQPSSQT